MPLLIIGSGRAALTLVSHLPEHMLNGAVVVDPSGNWLETWALRCLRQGVTYLRTPVTQVPFQSCTGLQDFIAKRGDREVDAVQSSARYVPLPSCRAFAEYCNAQVELSQRFRRVRMIEDTVADLEHVGGGSGSSAIRVTFSSGLSMVAAQVVHAARWSTPVVPSWMVEAKLFSRGAGGGPSGHGTQKAHEQHDDEDGGILGVKQRRGGGVGDINTLATLADVDVRTADVKGRSVVVVGGGMGACTLATAALRRGAKRVTLLCRGIIRRREQECDVAYFGNKGLAKFRAVQEPAKRLEILREAKGGFATINSQMWMQVQDALKKDGQKSGSGEEEDPMEPTFQIIERREIERVEWCDCAKRWRVIMSPFSLTETGNETSGTHSCTSTSMDDNANPMNDDCNTKCADEKPSSSSSASSLLELTADFVWAACGEIVDASQDPVLQNLLHKGGRIVGGYPVLVEDETQWISEFSSTCNVVTTAAANSLGSMRWPGLPLFFVGAYTSLSVGPGASLPAGHRLAARAVASAMHAHAKECRKSRGNNPYATGLAAVQLVTKVEKEDEGGIPRVLRLVPKSERHRALMDVRELKARTDDIDLPRVELSRYEIVDEDFLIDVRLTLPEAVPTERVRVAFTEHSVEVWAAGDKAAYRFFVAKLYKPIIVDRCTFKVSTKKKRITVVLHKFDNLSWRFLKG